jgi:hypothetical protein
MEEEELEAARVEAAASGSWVNVARFRVVETGKQVQIREITEPQPPAP